MNTVELVLVILLSIGFLTLLILGVVLISILIGIMRNVRRISQRAEEATTSVAELAGTLSSRLAPLAMSGLAAAAVRWFKARNRK